MIQKFSAILLLGIGLLMPVQVFSAAADDDDFDAQPLSTNLPPIVEDSSETHQGDDQCEEFHSRYKIHGITKDLVHEDNVKIQVYNRATKTITGMAGYLVKDKATHVKEVNIKHRNGTAKPVQDHRDATDIEQLIGWYRDTQSLFVYAVHLDDDEYKLQLGGYHEVSPLSQSYPNEVVRVYFKDNPSQLTLEVFIELRCPLLGISSQSHSLGRFKYQEAGSRLTNIGVFSLSRDNASMSRRVIREVSYSRPFFSSVPGLDQPDPSVFQNYNHDHVPILGVKAKMLKVLDQPSVPAFGDFQVLKEGSIKSPYLYVETAQTGHAVPQFFLTRTVKQSLQKMDAKGTGGQTAELKFTQKVGLAVDVEVITGSHSSLHQPTLVKGLLKQIAPGEWYPMSVNYTLSTEHPPYHLKITKVKTSQQIHPNQLLWDLYQARELFYSRYMELEVEHSFMPDGLVPTPPTTPALIPNFYKVVSKSYPSFPLPSSLRVLKVGGQGQPRFTLTTEHCEALGRLPLNRLILINAQVREEDLEKAMDCDEGHHSESLIDLRKGECLDTLDDSDPGFILRQTMEKERATQLRAEFERFCPVR